MVMTLSDDIRRIKGVGPKNAAILAGHGIETIEDLINYWPKGYEDYSRIDSIARLKPGPVTIKGTFSAVRSRRSRRGLHMTEALLSDLSGTIKVVWFNQPYRAASLKNGEEYLVSGDFGLKARSLSMTNPRVERAHDSTEGKILAIYRESKTLNSGLLRKAIKGAEKYFELIAETLPEWFIKRAKTISRAEALLKLHNPMSTKDIEEAKFRLGLEEVFHMQLAGLLTRNELLKEHSPKVAFDEKIAKDFVKHLPFDLTPDQRRTVWNIYQDMESESPMNRLVEGDVGSGKTVVACMAAVMAMKAGYQVLFMAPTEILARQHVSSMAALLEHTEWAHQIGLLVGGLSTKQKKEMHMRIANGECRLAVGTNALIQDKVATQNVGLVIIDEQHRFGVEQRTKLRTKAGLYPHVLCMTATPIPRTLALTLYGELEITQLKSMPKGRAPIITDIVEPTSRAHLYRTIDGHIAEGRQAFFVCPLIEENAELGLTAAETLYDLLRKGPFKHRRIGLLHGNMKPDEKDAVMMTYKKGEIDVLVSTTVIEVGVDVPNATVMVIESAERFGLAQIHQLRGRVGRGEHQGYCFLVPSQDQSISKRLRVLTYVYDGFKLSEIDLELRGPGAIYGVRQSGALDLRIAQLGDEKLIRIARALAQEFVERGENLLKYPLVAERVKHFRSVSKLN